MAVNPITDLDLEAFCRRRLLPLTSWQKDLMMRLDDAARAAWHADETAARAKAERQARIAADPQEASQVPVTNVAGVRAVLRSVFARANARAEAKAAEAKAAAAPPA